MKNNEILLYTSKISIENKIILFFTIVVIILITLMGITFVNLIFGISMIFLFIPIFLGIYLLNQHHKVKIFENKIYCRDFKHQNHQLKSVEIFNKDIISAQFKRTLIKEIIEINTTNGKYSIGAINFKDIIPKLKHQLKDKWIDN